MASARSDGRIPESLCDETSRPIIDRCITKLKNLLSLIQVSKHLKGPIWRMNDHTTQVDEPPDTACSVYLNVRTGVFCDLPLPATISSFPGELGTQLLSCVLCH